MSRRERGIKTKSPKTEKGFSKAGGTALSDSVAGDAASCHFCIFGTEMGLK